MKCSVCGLEKIALFTSVSCPNKCGDVTWYIGILENWVQVGSILEVDYPFSTFLTKTIEEIGEILDKAPFFDRSVVRVGVARPLEPVRSEKTALDGKVRDVCQKVEVLEILNVKP